MAFRRNFAPGTLGRSLRRWGPRFPSPGRALKRKQFGHFYSDADLQPDLVENPETEFLTLVTNADLAPPAAYEGMVPVRGLSFDVYLGLTMMPDFNASLVTAIPITWQYGFYVKDVDEDNLTLDTVFATHSMIKWGCWDQMAYAANGSASAFNAQCIRSARVRFRINQLKDDQEVMFAMQRDNTAALTPVLDGLFLAVRMRIRYEIP